MTLTFTCKTNHNIPYINSALFMTAEGKIITIDRFATKYSRDGDTMSMDWVKTYIWKENWEEENYLTEDQISSLSFVRLEIEDDAPADYYVEDVNVFYGDYKIPIKTFSISDIENFDEESVLTLCEERMRIKDHIVYFVDFGGYFGYSAVVFINGHHIKYANDYELHHQGKAREELRSFYINKMNRILFTEEEIAAPVTDYDEYDRKQYFLRNYYGMRVPYISQFYISKSENDDIAFKKKISGMVYNPIAFAYMNDRDFVKHHISLFKTLQSAKDQKRSDQEYWKNAFLQEMFNHEYSISWQADYDVLSVFGDLSWAGYGETKSLGDYFDELNFTPEQRRAYREAKEEYYQTAIF